MCKYKMFSDEKHGDGLSGAKHCHLPFPTRQSCRQISFLGGELNNAYRKVKFVHSTENHW